MLREEKMEPYEICSLEVRKGRRIDDKKRNKSNE